jgi:hypothetical protein
MREHYPSLTGVEETIKLNKKDAVEIVYPKRFDYKLQYFKEKYVTNIDLL